jgi:predicted ribosomally synthesized peptide with SipW-like signal peptide
MKSRIFMSMLVIALAAALVGGATMSIFTAEAETNERTYAAGTVKIAAGNQTFHEIDTLKNMAPGDTINGEFVVKNTGSLPLWFNVGYEASGFLFTGESEGGEEAVLNEENGDGEKHNATVTIIGKEFLPKELAPGEKETIGFKVHLPLEAGDEYQGATGNLKFLVNAEQYDHNPEPFEDDEPQEPDNEVVSFAVENFVIRDYDTWDDRDDRVEFNINNAVNAAGVRVSGEKTVGVSLETRGYGGGGSWSTLTGSRTVVLDEGNADDVGITLNGEVRSNVRNIKVTIDNAVVGVNL